MNIRVVVDKFSCIDIIRYYESACGILFNPWNDWEKSDFKRHSYMFERTPTAGKFDTDTFSFSIPSVDFPLNCS